MFILISNTCKFSKYMNRIYTDQLKHIFQTAFIYYLFELVEETPVSFYKALN